MSISFTKIKHHLTSRPHSFVLCPLVFINCISGYTNQHQGTVMRCRLDWQTPTGQGKWTWLKPWKRLVNAFWLQFTYLSIAMLRFVLGYKMTLRTFRVAAPIIPLLSRRDLSFTKNYWNCVDEVECTRVRRDWTMTRQRLHVLWLLREKNKLDLRLVMISTDHSVMSACYDGSRAADRQPLQQVTNTAQKVIPLCRRLPALGGWQGPRTHSAIHPTHHLFKPMPSDRCYRSVKTHPD